jgi:putative transposase
VLDTVPKKHQAEVKAALQAIASADTARQATALCDKFARTYRRPHPKAVERLARDWERMVAYYAFPKEHWRHLPTTNVIESPFAAVRLRTTAAKRFKNVENATALIWKTLLVVEHHFRKLNAPLLCTAVYDNVRLHDGICAITPPRKLHAA